MEKRLLNYLRCPICYASLRREDQLLICSGCHQTYSFFKNIPQLLIQPQDKDDWQNYFDHQLRKKGDTIAANSYLTQGHFRHLRQAVLEIIGEIKNMVIADIGCGTGHLTSSLASQNLLLGLDLSLEMLMAAERKGILPVQASATELPLVDEAFDLVLANSIIQCLADVRKFLTQLVRICFPGGRIIISGFNSQNIFLRAFRHLEITKRPPLFSHPLGKITGLLAEPGAKPSRILLLFYPSKIKKIYSDLKFINPDLLYLASSFVLEARKEAS